jgi:starch synthase (maltosyl-transferring)
VKPGSEEYLHSEKYEIRVRDLGSPASIRGLIAQVNGIRREHPSLQSDWSLRFHSVDNDRLIAYSKSMNDRSDALLVVVNLNPHNAESGWIEVPLERFGVAADRSFEVHDLLSGARYQWRGARNYIELNPAKMPAHIFKVRQ